MKLKTSLLAAALALASATASADILDNSTININGSLVPIGAEYVNNATGLDFLTGGVAGPADGTMRVGAGSTGSFTLFAYDTPGTIKDIASFAGFVPIAGFYNVVSGVNTLTFDLLSLTDITRTPASGSALAQLSISGTGMFHLFDGVTTHHAAGIFTLTTQNKGMTTFSASTVAQVPEPAPLALFGLAGLGLLAARRRKQAS